MSVLLGFIGVIIGALAVVSAGVLVESYKHHRRRQGTASAVAGEIYSILNLSERRKYVGAFTRYAEMLEVGQQVPIPRFLARPLELDPVIDRYLGSLGELGDQVPQRITVFHSYLLGIRHDLVRLADGVFDSDLALKARVIRESLALWNETVTKGNELLHDLEKGALEPWWPMAFCRNVWNRAIGASKKQVS